MYDDNDMYGTDGYRPHLHGSPLARISFFLGIASLMSALVIYISLPCGALAVIFALLSRTDAAKSKKCRASIICGICGMVLTTTITATAFYRVFTDPVVFNALESYMQMYMGDNDLDLKEELGGILPFLNEESDSEDGSSSENGRDSTSENHGAPSDPNDSFKKDTPTPIPVPEQGGDFV